MVNMKSEECVTAEGSGQGSTEEHEHPPEVLGTRTRSGRRVRTPALLADSQVPSPSKAPARRTRRSVLPSAKEESEEEQRVPGDLEAPGIPAVPVSTAMETVPAPLGETPQEKVLFVPGTKQTPVAPIPLGKPKSGRVWKERNKQRFSALVRDKPLCTSWGKKMAAKQEKQLVKTYCRQLKEDKAKEKEDKRKRQEETQRRRAENERKSEIVQVIRNTSKIKRMKKKQLRRVEKRDTLALIQKPQGAKTKGQRGRKESNVEN